jgi:hypothetical protein
LCFSRSNHRISKILSRRQTHVCNQISIRIIDWVISSRFCSWKLSSNKYLICLLYVQSCHSFTAKALRFNTARIFISSTFTHLATKALKLQISTESVHTAFATKATFFVATERARWIKLIVGVCPNNASF